MQEPRESVAASNKTGHPYRSTPWSRLTFPTS